MLARFAIGITFATSVLASCGGGGGGSVDSGAVVDDGVADEPSLPPTDISTLEAIVTTRYDSEERYDYWSCVSAAGTAVILLPPPGALGGTEQRGRELTTPGGDGADTLWSAVSSDALYIEYPDSGQALDFTGLVFSDIDTVSISGGANAPQECSRRRYGAEGDSSPEDPGPTQGDPSTPVQEPPGLAGMFGLIVYRLLPSGFFGATDDAILAFDDGSYTEDVSGVMRDGIAASRAANPGDWGRWRGTAGAIELQPEGETDYESTDGSWQIEPGGADERLDGCFTATGGVGPLGDGGIGSVSFATVCFYPDGRFTHNRSQWIQGPVVDITNAEPESRGRYRIDGNAIRFSYASGRSRIFAFGFNRRDRGDDDGSSIYLNDDLHLG